MTINHIRSVMVLLVVITLHFALLSFYNCSTLAENKEDSNVLK